MTIRPRVRNTFWFSSKSGRWTAPDDKKINLDNSLFRFVSAKGVTYNNFVAVLGLETPLTGLYSGGETEGTVYGLVDKDDSPLVVFLEGMDGSVWFSLK